MNEQPRSLRDLVVAAGERHPGASDRELGRRATSAGFALVGTTISGIRSGSYRSRPSHKTLDGLAWLAGVSRETAYAAAGEYLSPNPFADELPPEADKLTPKQRAAVIGVIRTMLDPGLPTAGTDEVPGATKAEPAAEAAGTVKEDWELARLVQDPEDVGRESDGRAINRAYATLGEESQDPGGDEPA